MDDRSQNEAAYSSVFRTLFPNATVPEVVGAHCSSQFAVSRERVQERPKSEYERIRGWLLETELADQISGRVLEYSWHSKPFMPFLCAFFWRLTYQFAKSSCKCLQSIVNLLGNAFAKLLGCATSHARRVVAIRDISFLDPPRYHRVGLRRDRVRTDGLHLVGVIDLQDGREKPGCRTKYFTLRTQNLLKMGAQGECHLAQDFHLRISRTFTRKVLELSLT